MDREPKNPFARALQAVKAERWYRATHNLKFLRGLLAIINDSLIGMRMREGSKKPRRDTLAVLMEKTFEGLAASGTDPTSDTVLHHLKDYDEEDICQEVTEDYIYWIDRRGREQKTTIGSFRNRLTKIRRRQRC